MINYSPRTVRPRRKPGLFALDGNRFRHPETAPEEHWLPSSTRGDTDHKTRKQVTVMATKGKGKAMGKKGTKVVDK